MTRTRALRKLDEFVTSPTRATFSLLAEPAAPQRSAAQMLAPPDGRYAGAASATDADDAGGGGLV